LPTIRRAKASDAWQLSEVAEKTFRDAFGAVNSAEDMDVHCRSSYGERIQADEISSPNMTTLLSEDEKRLVGFAQLRWAGAPKCVLAKSPGEIQRLYVLSDWHGKGAARDLMNACIEEMSVHGSDVVWLGVWERNQRAIAFYKKFGFVEVGDHAFFLGSNRQRDIVMARSVLS